MKLAHCFFLIDGFAFFFFPCGFQKPRDDECAFLQGICDFLQGPERCTRFPRSIEPAVDNLFQCDPMCLHRLELWAVSTS